MSKVIDVIIAAWAGAGIVLFLVGAGGSILFRETGSGAAPPILGLIWMGGVVLLVVLLMLALVWELIKWATE